MDDRQVTQAEGGEKATSWGVPFVEASARERVNIEGCFYDLVREIRKDNGGVLLKKKKKKGACTVL